MKQTPTPYFSLVRHPEEHSADIYIFGNIAQNRGGLAGLFQSNSDQSSYDLANQVESIPEDWALTVHVNSNGGELKEGLGIYNVLKSRDNVTTICEGFAASAGSLVFCAGKTRIMQPASLLFIHQASMDASGNADDFQKASDDLRVVTAAAVAAYRECGVNVEDDALSAMLKAETWITPEDAVAMGFATEIADVEQDGDGVIINDAMCSIMAAVTRPDLNDEALAVMKAFSDAMAEHAGLLKKLELIADKVNEDPDLPGRINAAVQLFLGMERKTVTKKGFFGFKGE